jgi:hypothetical protein
MDAKKILMIACEHVKGYEVLKSKCTDVPSSLKLTADIVTVTPGNVT